MNSTVSLQLPDQTLHLAQAAASQIGRSLEAVLLEWIERGSTRADLCPEPEQQHTLYSPLGGEATAQALRDFLKLEEERNGL